jgi:hypothetical protein
VAKVLFFTILQFGAIVSEPYLAPCRLINVVFNLFMVQVPQLARRKSTTIKKGAEVVRWGADTSALAPIRL